MDEKKAIFRIRNFNDLDPISLKMFFKNRLNLDSKGFFKEEMTLEEAEKIVRTANTWWTGKDLELDSSKIFPPGAACPKNGGKTKENCWENCLINSC